ncbi:hypothetical protein [Actinotalea sp. K2]|uniref:hypothetical protein n=1 Tax=Actinotalea sp. K2 TaxID=2939438 RepID=UPI002017E1BD|nr:hypothetical protein [Actinotalea sp. K2]MCL3859978.1 hypothetical protein [Actinotalea sp. K2]
MTTTTLTLTDRLHARWYLTRFGWAMQDYPGRQTRQIRRELHADLVLAAQDVGMAQALRDLGHPVVLAERYIAELGRRLPRKTTGAVAAALAMGLILYLSTAYAIGTLDTLEAMGGGSITTYPLGAETVFTHTEDELSVSSSLTWQWALLYVGAGVVAFLGGSRIWRAFG